tara:strand:- start:221 stop:562 length:342 start_codon:yes stop_codon:yes gene_type:complete
MIVFSILISNGIPDHNLEGEPHILVTDHGAFACIDLASDGEPISSWAAAESQALTWDEGVVVMTDEHNLWTCPSVNLVALEEANAEGTLSVVWAALGELRRLGLNCPQTCGTD